MYVLLPAALLFAVAAVIVFAWAARSGQFDDLETPAYRILGEDDPSSAAPPQAPRASERGDAARPPRQDGRDRESLDVRDDP